VWRDRDDRHRRAGACPCARSRFTPHRVPRMSGPKAAPRSVPASGTCQPESNPDLLGFALRLVLVLELPSASLSSACRGSDDASYSGPISLHASWRLNRRGADPLAQRDNLIAPLLRVLPESRDLGWCWHQAELCAVQEIFEQREQLARHLSRPSQGPDQFRAFICRHGRHVSTAGRLREARSEPDQQLPMRGQLKLTQFLSRERTSRFR
jgi:hypothetical protein